MNTTGSQTTMETTSSDAANAADVTKNYGAQSPELRGNIMSVSGIGGKWLKKIVGAAALATALAAGAGSTAYAQVNDNLAGRIVITNLSGSIGGSNAGATKEPGEPDPDGSVDGAPYSASVWYQWMAPASGPCTFTATSSMDPVLGIYTDPVPDFPMDTTIGENDDFSGLNSQVSFTASGGITYYVLVGSFASGSGNNFTLSWNTTPVNNAPVANDDPSTGDPALTTAEDTAITVNVLANDTDANSDPLTITNLTLVTGSGTLSVVAGGVQFTPATNFNGPVSFTYTANDGTVDSNTATVSLTVTPVNDAPVAVVDGPFTINEDSIAQPDPSPNLLINDTDPDGDPLTAERGTAVNGGGEPLPAGSVVAVYPNGNWGFTPPANYNGPASFTYRVFDGELYSDFVTINLTITSVNDVPVANDDSYTTLEDTNVYVDPRSNDTDVENDPLVTTILSGPTNGTLTPDGLGAFDYSPNPNYFGTDSFTYQVSDGTANSNVATVNITITSVNDVPVAMDDSYVTGEEQTLNVPIEFSVLNNDSDVEDPAGSLLAELTSVPSYGLVTLNPNGTFTYTPQTNFSGLDTFTYQVTDSEGASDTATVSIFVGVLNDAPVAQDDVYQVDEDTLLDVTTTGVLLNDSDSDIDDVTTAGLVTNPVNGTLVFNQDGSFTYQPFANFTGTDSFKYQAFDRLVMSNVATVTINVTAVNDGPVANDDLYSAMEDTVLTISAPGVLANDFDTEGGPLTASLASAPTFGSVVLNANGGFVYTPPADFNGVATFTYSISDGELTDTAMVTINVASVNDAPFAAGDSYSTDKNTALTVAPNGVLNNDSDPEGDALTAALVQGPLHGSLALSTNGGFTYTPFTNYSGTDSFTYQAKDASLSSNIATVTIAINNTNTAPVAAADSYTTAEDQVLTVSAPGVLANDTDGDGDTLTAVLQSNPANGTVALNGNGGFIYTPNLNFNGTDTFTYSANDGTSNSQVTTATITVTPVNDTPVAADDSYVTDEDTTLTVVAPGVLTNDTDVDGPSLTAMLVTQPQHGTVQLGPLGSVVYVPDANFFGTDSFTYRATDGSAFSSLATVTITVNPVNDAPVGNADNFGTFENTTITVPAPGVLADDVDVEGDALTAVLYSTPGHGLLVFNGDGSFSYAPNAGYSGTDQFFYRASDGQALSALTTVTITIGSVDDAPVAADDSYFVFEDTVTTVPAAGVLSNDFDPEDDVLTATLISGASHGTVVLQLDGGFTYTPNPGFTGIDTFTYQANDGVSDSNVATVTINVMPKNDEPLANEDFYSTDEEQPITVAAPGVLGNDFDDDGDALTALLRDNPLHGVVSLNGDGSFTYTPDEGFSGTDVLTYQANDGTTNSNVTTVTILVRPINDVPVAVNDTYIANEDTTLTVSAPGVLANDTDADGDALSSTLVVAPLHGTLILNADGSFEYLGFPNYAGPDSFIYRATDGLSMSAPATVNITVVNTPDAPVANADLYGTQENLLLSINAPGVLANDSDLDGDTLTAILVNNPVNGTVALQPNGGFVYTPNTGFNGVDVFTYIANDGSTNSLETTVTITVGLINDAPVANDDVFNVFEDQTTTISAPGVLANDTDADSTVLTSTLVTGPLNGTVVLNLDGSFTYTPFANLNGQDSFTYQANDGIANSNVATVILTVLPLGDGPIANPDNYSTNEEQPITVAAPGVLGNDMDDDGDTLTALLQDNPLNGTVSLNGNGGFTYTPANGFSGTDRFTYRANDGSSNSDLTTVTITVLPVNDAPVARADTFVASEDTTLTVVAPGVLQNDTDDDGDTLMVTLVVPPLHGSLVLNSDGSFVYVPNPNYFGNDQFTYRAEDASSVSNDAVVTISVQPVQDVPVANPDNYSTQENTLISVPAPGVLANDVDLDGDALSAIQVDSAINGVLSFPGDGSFIYTPNANFNGVDTFTYQATDGTDVSNITTVTITVGAVNDAPVAVDDVYNVFEDMVTTVSAPGVLANDTDTDEPTTLTAVLINGPLNGTVVLNSDGSFTYTPFMNYNGPDSFTYQANDGMTDSNVATVFINVVPQDDAPLANEDFYVVDEDQSITVAAPGVLGNDSDADGDTLTALLQAEPAHGIISLNGDGSFTYTPDLGFFGSDFFTYQANDGLTSSDPTTATIVVRPRNDRPVAISDTYVVDEDTTLSVPALGVLANDTDEDNDPLTATLEVAPLHGVVTLNADGSFVYVPASNYNGTDSFTYRANDGIESSNPATVTIVVTPVQDVPVANDNNYSTPEDTPITVAAPGILGNDVDPDGETLTALLVDNVLSGTLALNGNGSFTYTPNADFTGTDSFTYQANDGTENSNLATVTITVGVVNDVPVANPDVYSLFEDTTANVAAPGVLQNDTDSDNDTLTANLITGPLFGTLTLNPDGSFIYTPMADFTGTDSFTYQATDGVSDSNITTVTLNVVAQTDQPIANADFYSTTEELALVVASPGVLGNDFDADGEALTALLEDNPLNGVVALAGDGSFIYTPNADFSGTDVFTYRANDGTQNSDVTTVTITVLPLNDRPTANSDNYIVDEDATLTVVAPGVLVNDTDQDNDPLTAVLEVAPLHGTLALNSNGGFVYIPTANYNGPDSFTYRANDGTEDSNPATVTITVRPVQDVPVANDDNYSAPEDTPITIAAPGVLGNDFDQDGEQLTALLVDSPTGGIVALNGNGSFTYTPNLNYTGTDTFTYRAQDGTSVSNLATVTIVVGLVNDIPVANPDFYSLFEDTTSNVAAPGVLQNDTDGDNDTLMAKLIIGPLYGTLTLNTDGSFSYTPMADFNGTDTFTYQATDGISDSNVTTVTLNVVPRSDIPLANADFYSTNEDVQLVVAKPGVLGNDFDADNQVLIALIEDNPLNGLVSLSGDGSFIYTPDEGYFGTDLFTYRAHDGTQNSDKTTVTITIRPRNDVPISVDDIYNAVEDTPLTVPASNGVLANDFDLDGDVLTAVLINQPLSGSVALAADGSFTYTPNANFNGQDYFIYRAYDGKALSAPARVTIRVAPVQDTPVAVNDMYSIPEDKVLSVVAPGVLGNDIDVDGETLTGFLVDAPDFGIIQFNMTGGFTYTPDENFFGIDTFTYYANDGTENSNLATVTISVGGRNDGSVAVDDLYFTPEDVPLVIPAPGVLGNDTDADGDTLQAVLITPALQGVVTLNPDGSFVYTPNLNYTGPDRFVYRASDGTTLSNPATVTINVTSINDAPVISNMFVTPALNENDTAVLTADLFDADMTDTFLAIVNWGDGSVPSYVSYPAGTSKIFLTHQYLDDNPTGTPVDTNLVTLTIQDNNAGADTETLPIVVSNIAPNLENLTLTQVVPTGGQARLRGLITDIGTRDTFVLTVNWGDGTVDTTNHGPGASAFDFIHAYAVPGTYTVTVTVMDDDGGIRSATPSLLVRNTADLVLLKNANPDPASVGELVTYTMIITNNGPDTARNVILMDILPTNVEITSSTPSLPFLVPADGVLNWFLGDMASGQTMRVDLIVKTKQQGPITNIATVISDELDPNEANNTASVTTTIGWLPDGPDLMADAVTVDTVCKNTKKGPKCKMKLWALVANRGNQRANSCVYSVYLSDDAIFHASQDLHLKTKRLRALFPGQVIAQNQTIKTPPGFTTTGKFMIVVLDEGNIVFEGNETNNYLVIGPLP